jgi:ubiquinone/menaquinone biosynthesis C-methylase UbiE
MTLGDVVCIDEVMDARNTTYPSESFDMAIDKSTLDALLCGDFSFVNVAQMTKEVQRVLKTDGYYFIVSFGAPENRLLHLKHDFLLMEVTTVKLECSPGNHGAVPNPPL